MHYESSNGNKNQEQDLTEKLDKNEPFRMRVHQRATSISRHFRKIWIGCQGLKAIGKTDNGLLAENS